MASTNVALNVADSIYLQGQGIRTRGANLTFESPCYLRMQIVSLFYWVLTHSFHRGKHLVRTRGRGKMSVQHSTRAKFMFSSFFALSPKLLHNLVPNVSTPSWMVLFFYACVFVCARVCVCFHVSVSAIYVCWGEVRRQPQASLFKCHLVFETGSLTGFELATCAWLAGCGDRRWLTAITVNKRKSITPA